MAYVTRKRPPDGRPGTNRTPLTGLPVQRSQCGSGVSVTLRAERGCSQAASCPRVTAPRASDDCALSGCIALFPHWGTIRRCERHDATEVIEHGMADEQTRPG